MALKEGLKKWDFASMKSSSEAWISGSKTRLGCSKLENDETVFFSYSKSQDGDGVWCCFMVSGDILEEYLGIRSDYHVMAQIQISPDIPMPNVSSRHRNAWPRALNKKWPPRTTGTLARCSLLASRMLLKRAVRWILETCWNISNCWDLTLKTYEMTIRKRTATDAGSS